MSQTYRLFFNCHTGRNENGEFSETGTKVLNIKYSNPSAFKVDWMTKCHHTIEEYKSVFSAKYTGWVLDTLDEKSGHDSYLDVVYIADHTIDTNHTLNHALKNLITVE